MGHWEGSGKARVGPGRGGGVSKGRGRVGQRRVSGWGMDQHEALLDGVFKP
jgi:hypothetical protein